ncbi:pyruvyl transferase [Brooklawnia cerclae]|uniref:Pyruvyl transferase n=2 Tax=Brooklawnia cerclae TaxID=349934 RepID=A0ABX0SER7_9ACTN|nr:pyruvyl transferase [Brooklawnia cerclae]
MMHFLRHGDHVWGTGINGKIPDPIRVKPDEVEIYAVRGPRTWGVLTQHGFNVPHVFGDPAILLAEVDKRFQLNTQQKTRRITVIPNLNDISTYRSHPGFVSPLQDPLTVAREIATSELVVGSSLHALILADVLGVPSRWVTSSVESPFKYIDYYEGTGRDAPAPAENVEQAIRIGGIEPYAEKPNGLIEAFPRHLFEKG